ncbi:MAG: DUF1559 domain-containing protein [Planctomycetaceae bacterium]
MGQQQQRGRDVRFHQKHQVPRCPGWTFQHHRHGGNLCRPRQLRYPQQRGTWCCLAGWEPPKPGVAAIQAYGQAIQAAYNATPSNTHHHAGRLWALGQHSQSLFNTTATPNWPIPNGQECTGCGWMDSNGIFPSRSRHAGGSQHLFADGSVHFISSNIDMGLYQGLGTRAGGEVVQFP